MSDNTQEEAHTGPIKTPKQLLLTVFFGDQLPTGRLLEILDDARRSHAGVLKSYEDLLPHVETTSAYRSSLNDSTAMGKSGSRARNRPLTSGAFAMR